jgi:hypothetical protein
MDLKTQALVSNKSQTIKVIDLFDLTNTNKYIVLNVYGYASGSTSGILYASNKVVPYAKLYSNVLSKTIIFELTNGEYVNSVHGKLTDVKFKTSATTNALNVITMGTVSSIDPSYYSDNVIGNIQTLVNKILPTEYSAAILTSPTVLETSVKNLIDVAKSYVGLSWDVQKPWALIETMAAKIGTSLPIASIGHTNDAISNGNWVLEYNGNKPFGDWKQMLDPGDIVMMTSPDRLTDTVAVVTGGKNETALVIDTAVNSKNLTKNIVKILPEHLLSSEDVYSKTDQYHVFIYTLKNSAYTSPTNTSTVINTTSNYNTPSTPYKISGSYTDAYVTPVNDLTFGINQVFKVVLPKIFTPVSKTGSITTGNSYQSISQAVINLPSWAKYDPYTGALTGKTPGAPTQAHLSVVGTLGNQKYTDFLDINVTKNLTVNISDTIWTAGYNHTLQVNTGLKTPYFMSYNGKSNLTWLHINKTTGEISGIPPLSQIGQSFDVTVYQKASAQSAQSYTDSFTLSISNPINLVGSPLNVDYYP